MKTKDQKRREAIERLERLPYWNQNAPMPDGWLVQTREKRLSEARRLRDAFGVRS
jgi:hypothetical protein